MTNVAAARQLVERTRAAGVTDFCVCAGSRNSPLLKVLGETEGVRLFSFVDERSAAFFALGRTKQHGQPAAVVTTSGTAVAELLPAAIEAHYSRLPIVLITADRPARYRGTGAPQAIEQVGLFGVYAATSFELWDASSPLHLNIEFDEPLIDDDGAPCHPERERGAWAGGAAQRVASAPVPPPSRPLAPARGDRALILVGGLAARDRDRVRDFALRANAPVYAEPLSGLREDPALAHLHVLNERMLARGGFDRVIRIGNIPTLRFWRDLDEKLRDLPVVSFSANPFTGLSRGEIHALEALPEPVSTDRDEAFFAEDREKAAAIARILDDEPQSELAMIRNLSRELPHGARVYLGNSLPIREWDLVATREPRGYTYEANRGANGIDGQLSTFFGWCKPLADNVCMVGDLTTIYDLNAPWIVPQLEEGVRFRIVIVNNGGGRIFSRVASLKPMDPRVRNRIIENAHDVHFEQWAAMWGIDVTELRPDAEATARVWARYDALW